MEIDRLKLLVTLIESTSFISAFAAVSAGFIMYGVTKKFGTGILANGFKTISGGVMFIALGIVVDVIELILEFADISHDNIFLNLLFLIQGLCFVIGTYTIVIGSKRLADKLEELTR